MQEENSNIRLTAQFLLTLTKSETMLPKTKLKAHMEKVLLIIIEIFSYTLQVNGGSFKFD